MEVTSLIAGVLLHETAWAERLSQAAEFRPHVVRRCAEADDRRRHYEQITEHYPQVTEKLADWYLWLADPADDRHAVTLWLVHRWIEERFSTDEEAVPAVLADGFVARLLDVAPSMTGQPLGGRAEALSTALRTVAAGLAVGAPAEDQRLPPDQHVIRRTPWHLRARPLAALLRRAGLLAFDARCLPEVLAEHLAVSDPVMPSEVVTVLRDAFWYLDQDGSTQYLHLDALCPHPAIHAALASVVEDADDLGHLLRESVRRLPHDEAALLRGLPARLSDHRLRPDREHGMDAYDVPLARFSLAQTEIRRLLMGEQLYEGEPELALRELYQNAMDACRYREMRVRYLRDLGREPAEWAGRIRIEVGEDSRGHYVECVDTDGHPTLPWAATIELAAESDTSVWGAERVLAREAERLGVAHRRRYTERSSGRDVVPSPDTGNLVRWLHQEHIRLEEGVSLRDLACVRSHETSSDELSWYLDELRETSVDLPDAAELLRAWDDLADAEQIRILRGGPQLGRCRLSRAGDLSRAVHRKPAAPAAVVGAVEHRAAGSPEPGVGRRTRGPRPAKAAEEVRPDVGRGRRAGRRRHARGRGL
ncbi:hypothetical protein STRCI_004333 [Streptomyces cinnabarinus]|uniref:iHD-CE domain-containing protein n=1 Tax=Streptomyces cinnabarinus TaxID=67287 RepID=A0ABY7KJW6_9ACTN|nr:hypothetical protein [Streptomyces cinnabarinus]WAZ23021.1 hypothetical protein STRCI_004333 [Streptomyces cinnabarinus]